MEEVKGDNGEVINLVNSGMHFRDKLVRATRLGKQASRVQTVTPQGSSASFTTGSRLVYDVGIAQDTLVKSQVEVRVKGNIRFVHNVADGTYGADATASANAIIAGLKDKFGLRPCAINEIISNAFVQINGQSTFNTPISDTLPSILYGMNQAQLSQISSVSKPEQLYDYYDINNMNPLRSVADATTGTRGLGSFVIDRIAVAGDFKSADVSFTHTEQLLARPFQFWDHQSPDFTGVNRLRVELTLGDITRMLCNVAAAPFAITNTTFTIQNMDLLVSTYSPLATATIQVPDICYWNSPELEILSATEEKKVAAGAGTGTIPPATFSTNPINRSVVPRMYAIYAVHKSATQHDPDRYLPIVGIKFRQSNRSNCLAELDARGLYELSQKNGYNGTFHQFSGGYPGMHAQSMTGNGCIVYITPEDLDSTGFLQSNVALSHPMQCEIQVKNPEGTETANTVKVCVVAFNEVVMVMNKGAYSDSYLPIKPSELVNAELQYVEDVGDSSRILGGSFWSTLSDWGSQAANGLKSGLRWIRDPETRKAIRDARQGLNSALDFGSTLPGVLGTAANIGKAAMAIPNTIGEYAGYGNIQQRGGADLRVGGKKASAQELMAMMHGM